MKKHSGYRPREYGYWLEKAMMGHNIPVANLKSAFKYREVPGYREQSLVCRGNTPYVQMVQCLGGLLKKMGYKGLLLFFDEAESIAQAHIRNRAKSYEILDQFFQNNGSVYPIFAFTDDFFDKVSHEPYDHREKEIFIKNFAHAWRELNIVRLQDFSSQGWESLLDRLIRLYSQAYRMDLPDSMKETLQSVLKKMKTQETRSKLKALVNILDVESQRLNLCD